MKKKYLLFTEETTLNIEKQTRIILKEMIIITNELLKFPTNNKKLCKIPTDAILIIGTNVLFPKFEESDSEETFQLQTPVIRASCDCSINNYKCEKTSNTPIQHLEINGNFHGNNVCQMLWDDLHPSEHNRIATQLGIDRNFAWICQNISNSKLFIKTGTFKIPSNTKIYIKKNDS